MQAPGSGIGAPGTGHRGLVGNREPGTGDRAPGIGHRAPGLAFSLERTTSSHEGRRDFVADCARSAEEISFAWRIATRDGGALMTRSVGRTAVHPRAKSRPSP